MTVGELRTALREYPDSWFVHLDISINPSTGPEGDRIVRNAQGVRIQQGFRAVAIDGDAYIPGHDSFSGQIG